MKYISELKLFKIDGEPIKIESYGCGHINETYYAETDTGRKYILQRINSKLFTNVEKLMRNIELVTEFIGNKIKAAGGDPFRETLTIVHSKSDRTFVHTDNGYFRVYIFIDNATCYQIVAKPEDFYESAFAFGNFQKMLADFNAAQLFEVIPDFHNTRVRFENFKTALAEDKCKRAESVAAEIEFVLDREDYCGRIVDMLKAGIMPLKVTHNDTKLNNVMIDDATGKGIAVIDLDTVMPGSSAFDFGDSIRFGCNPAAEDEKDLSKVNFRMDLFETYCKGYFAALGKDITKVEKENLAFGAILMTYECGMRFLADHLSGDTYFKVHRENHNLDRARTQFKLVADMEENLAEMNKIVAKF